MPNPLLVINSNWWRKHITLFLFLFHPSDLIFSSGVCSWWVNSRFQVIHLSFRSCNASWLYCHGAPSESLQGFYRSYFQLSFCLIILLLPEFSRRLKKVVHQGFLSFFNCSSRFLLKLWPTKLYSKINMVFNTRFVFRSSSILHLAFRSAILSTLSFVVVLCHSW